MIMYAVFISEHEVLGTTDEWPHRLCLCDLINIVFSRYTRFPENFLISLELVEISPLRSL